MQNVKGTYDFFGKEQAVRQKVRGVLQEVFELYDFVSMESTVLHELDLLTSKYAGGDEILKEMYRFTDQGGRKLGLRYDLTIPFAKVMALNPGIKLPYRRYEIGKVFRDGPVKRGRLREFLQCDVDMVGVEGPEAEAELMLIAVEVFKRLAIPVTLRWNNRRFLSEILGAVGVPAEESLSVMLTLDKLEKIGSDGILAELGDKGISGSAVEEIAELIAMDEPSFGLLAGRYSLKESQGAAEVRALQTLIDKLKLSDICRFDPFLSRGLSFYTGTVYEIFDASGVYASSIGSGGRYDAIIGKLIGNEDMTYPAAGLSLGMESIMEMIRDQPFPTQTPKVVVLSIGDTRGEALMAATVLRSGGIQTGMEPAGRKLKKALASLESRAIRYALLIGEEEARTGKVRLKDMKAREEYVVPLDEALYLLEKNET
ncbi:histidine--tRNA ligase 1 [Paenibacillus glycanilyticus]|uniref:Histidine--tRNA ligase n=1 Tax=Paenibacillus glycanilyticus TaxID=126569 RepID=A0ABQ6NMZ9_9BACL|nr:histidine--tRNA ligase [Paenibacillus glycanilyticus]GMK45910.1 histidine--tRNA ligase 1 [Paenibacillus glycanilyticus]